MTIDVKSCPMCGAPVNPKDRDCGYCGSALIIISTANILSRDIDIKILNDSLDKWKEKLKVNTNDPSAHYAIGMIYINKQLRDAAIKHLNIAVENEPEFSLAHFNLSLALFDDGNILLDSQDYYDCNKEMEYAEKTDPEFNEAQAFKHFYIARKLDYVDKNEAIKEYQIAIGKCSDIPVFYNNLGLDYLKIGNKVEAEKNFKKAIELDSNHTMAFSNICELYFETQRYSEGLTYGELGVSSIRNSLLDSYKALMHNNYALCLWKSNRKEDAIANLKKAIAYNPETPLFQNNLKTIQTGCFIATATMGDYDHPVVVDLRTFRDNWLLKRKWGVVCTNWYYIYGSKVAKVIEKSNFYRKITFLFLIKPLHLITKRIRYPNTEDSKLKIKKI